jgi:hypothetical protein
LAAHARRLSVAERVIGLQFYEKNANN